ncbi:MAG TPA: hypothetical protein VMB79_05885 [Jatrophihabitans sp.]|nr:hypothetical protein [Jatrophihabitans sp.]
MIVRAVSEAGGALDSALIAAVVSLVVALLGALSSARLNRREHRYQRRRAALLDVQDAALRLRQALAAFGELARANPAMPTKELLDAEREFDRALGLLDVMLSRVDTEPVRHRVTAWRLVAQVSFISSHDASSPADEQRAWSALNAAVGAALTDAS